MKLVAEEYGRNDLQAVQRYVATGLAILMTTGAGVLATIVLLKSSIIAAFSLTGENARVGIWLLPYMGCLSVYVFIVQALNATLSGLGRMDLANWIQLCGRFVAVAATTILLYAGYGIESLLIGSSASYATIHLLSHIAIHRIARVRLFRLKNLSVNSCRRLLRFGGGVFGSSLLGMLVSPFNKLMLSRYAGVETVPVYEIAYQAACVFRSIFDSAIRAIMPEISRLSGERTIYGMERIRSVNARAMRIIGAIALPSAGILMLAAEPLLEIWLGDRYLSTIPTAFRIMLIVMFISLVSVPAHYTIMGLGKVRYFVIAGIIGGGGDCLLVTISYLLTGCVSVNSIGMCMIVVFAVSTTYVMLRAHQLMGRHAEEVRYSQIAPGRAG